MPKINIEEILNELFKDYGVLTLLISILILFIQPQLNLIAVILLFSAFDFLAFDRIVKTNNKMKGLITYRIIQTILQYSLVYFLFINSGLATAIWFMLFWFFGVCDMLYYIIGKQSFINEKDMYWLWWTPIGILNKSAGLKTSGYQLVEQSMFIIIIYLITFFQ